MILPLHLKKILATAFFVAFSASQFCCAQYHVKLGEKRVFTKFNLHRVDTMSKPYHPTQGSPTILEAISEGSQSTTHVGVDSYQEGYAKSWIGIDFVVEKGNSNDPERTAIIDITLSYEINVEFNVIPPRDGGGGGSIDAIVYYNIREQKILDRIHYVHEKGKVSNISRPIRKIRESLLLTVGDRYEIFIHNYSYCDVYFDSSADSNTNVTVDKIEISYEHKIFPPIGGGDDPDPPPVEIPSICTDRGNICVFPRTPLPYPILYQNFPNPFNSETKIHFSLPNTRHTVLKIFNCRGQEIRTLLDAQYPGGSYSIYWDGKNGNGNAVAPGMYIYRIQAGDYTEVKKMALVR